MARPRTVSDERIIAATIAAIGRHGPAKLTLAHVADEVGLTPGAIVQRFGSKAALLAAVAAGATDYAKDVFARARASTSSPLEAIREATVGMAGDIHDHRELANHLAMLQLDLADPHLREQAAEQSETIRRHLRDLLAQAITTGELVGVHPGDLARTIHVAYSGALITWAIEGEDDLGGWIRDRVGDVLRPYETAQQSRVRTSESAPSSRWP